MDNAISFLSKDNLIKHNEYLKRLRLEYAILEKSYPELVGLSSWDIRKINLERRIKLEVYAAKLEIELHELFFSSFLNVNAVCRLPFVSNASQAGFLYEAEQKIKNTDGVFFIMYKNKNGLLDFQIIKNYTEAPEAKPELCIDLCEHSYFSDYCFDKQRYIKEALFHLNFNKIN